MRVSRGTNYTFVVRSAHLPILPAMVFSQESRKAAFPADTLYMQHVYCLFVVGRTAVAVTCSALLAPGNLTARPVVL